MTTRHRVPLGDDPAREPLLQLARRQRIKVRFDRIARQLGMPHVSLETRPGGTAIGLFKNSAAALRWLQGAVQ